MKASKRRRMISIYAVAAIAVLSVYSAVTHTRLEDYRTAARYSASHAYEETAAAVKQLSASLEKSLYATDGGMCGKVCSAAYADAMAAQAAMSTLPFSTAELEQVSAFLNVAGDYTYTLCSSAAETGFTEEQLKALDDMSARAAEFSNLLEELKGYLNDGTLIMDSREQRLENVGVDPEASTLGGKLLEYDSAYKPGETPEYDGRYAAQDKQEKYSVSREDAAKTAAAFTGADEDELTLDYEYENGSRCYSYGDIYVCVGGQGVESVSSSRLVEEEKLSMEEAQLKAEEFLTGHGYNYLVLQSQSKNGAIAAFKYSCKQGETLCRDNCISIAIALDNGAVHSLDATDYCTDQTNAEFSISAEQAQQGVPQTLSVQNVQQTVIENECGADVPCYEFDCSAENGRKVKIWVNANTGRQQEITITQ